MSRSSNTIHAPEMLTREETRVLDECDRESIIYRSIPFSIFTFFAMQYAMSKNKISTKGKWIKLGASVFAGYMIGKVSYAFACQKKILAEIPDSNLGRMIRGAQLQSIADADTSNDQEKSANDSTTFTSNNPLKPIGLNQYGDPVYKTNK